jgi:hypothetical protein
VVGDGMIPHIFKTMRTNLKDYVQTYEG